MAKSESSETEQQPVVQGALSDPRPLVSLLLPAFDEQSILATNVDRIRDHMRGLEDRFRWEALIINDGSSDETGRIADQCATDIENVRVVHHARNRGLGEAIKTGVANTAGDYMIVLDVDLSYDVDHISQLLEELLDTGADLVLASPYMKGGSIGNVPWFRKKLSIFANRFLSLVAHGSLSTLTCMVRGYKGDFARSLVLRSTGMEVMPETVYKTMILRGHVRQIPARLDWGTQASDSERKSSMRVLRQILGTLLSGFLFRPFMFFILPGLLLLLFSLWVNSWMVVHFIEQLALAPETATSTVNAYSWAVAEAYKAYPHTFIVGLLSLMLAIQLTSLGILALQSKTYFEELFYLGSTAGRRAEGDRSDKRPTN